MHNENVIVGDWVTKFIARSALSSRAAHPNLLSFVRSFFVREIIDFCREDLRAASLLLSTESLTS